MESLIDLYEIYKKEGHDAVISVGNGHATLVIKEIPVRITVNQLEDGELEVKTRCPASATSSVMQKMIMVGLGEEYQELKSSIST